MIKRLIEKINSTGGFNLNSEDLKRDEFLIFIISILITIVVKILLIPYNMMDMGDSATRVWNAWDWAQNPFFVLPQSGHPFWFYFMGLVFKITHEMYYTSAITMIILMTIAGIYLFKTTLLIADFKTALLAYFIYTLNPVIFRLNFEPYSQQTYLAAACIMVYFMIKAIFTGKTRKYLTIAGIFAIIAASSRPEAIFVLLPYCVVMFFIKAKGAKGYIVYALIFQVFWIALSLAVYGVLFKTFQAADSYTGPVNIQGLSMAKRLEGFFMPYLFLVAGITFILFYFFVKGLIYSHKRYPLILNILLFIPVICPALVNGTAGLKSAIYLTTHYIYLMFFFSSIYTAIGLKEFVSKYKNSVVRVAFSSIIILTCIPLSYIKEVLPEKYVHYYPKIVELVVTSEDAAESRKQIKFVDENADRYPAIIFDCQFSASSVFYIPYRTKLSDDKILISGYNVPPDEQGLSNAVRAFINNHPKGMIIFKKTETAMNRIFTEALEKQNLPARVTKKEESDKWVCCTYE
ncbi:MAG: glycosyltransferase family 39 protein [Ignavibacteria bacterium]